MSVLLLLAVATASPMAEAPASKPALDYSRLIDDAIDGGRIIQAETMLAQWRASAQAQESAAVDIAVARMALAKGENAEAETRFAAMNQTGSKDCRVDEGLGIARLRRGRTEQAADALRRAVDRCAGRWRAWNALGVAYDAEKAWALSAAVYEKAFQLTDKPVQVLNNYGLSLMAQGQADRAAAIFGKALEMAPDDARIITHEDAAQIMAGRDIERRPADNADRWAKRLGDAGQVALRMGDAVKARAYLSRAVTESESFQPEAAAALATMGAQP
jgi:Tfp pilus assembly protein PilF